MWKDFKAFALKGNVVDMAIGIIIGGAFGKIVSSMVADVLMPPIGLLMGNVDFSGLFINLSRKSYASLVEAKAESAPTINYGVFINHLIDFAVVAFCMFVAVRIISRMTPKPPAPPATKDCPFCLSTIPANAARCAHCTSALNP
ncbi:MAG TPA: large conductance mechanosensitive channel protein MscL [Elusimicrobia bacterium]|nr:large conductance mechanosensitive channel protein MscL [Elusimicrobiota bacterium]HBT62702.1 large conductance mechanosensitive channel protein MscL [Elusimicrobiota bacterium]